MMKNRILKDIFENNTNSFENFVSFYMTIQMNWTLITSSRKSFQHQVLIPSIIKKTASIIKSIGDKYTEIFATHIERLEKQHLSHPFVNYNKFLEEFNHEFKVATERACSQLNRDVILFYPELSEMNAKLEEMLKTTVESSFKNLKTLLESFYLCPQTLVDIYKYVEIVKNDVNDLFSQEKIEDILELSKEIFEMKRIDTKSQQENHVDDIRKYNALNSEQTLKLFEFVNKNYQNSRFTANLPSSKDIEERLKGNDVSNQRLRWVEFNILMNHEAINRRILYQFRYFKEENYYLSIKRSVEEDLVNAFYNSITEHIKKFEDAGVLLNTPLHIKDCITECMYLYYKSKERKLDKSTADFYQKYDIILEREQNYFTSLLESEDKPREQGRMTAETLRGWMVDDFLLVSPYALKTNTIVDVKKELTDSQKANLYALEQSFRKRNYENVVKYIVDINKFIRECYSNRVKAIAQSKIEASADILIENFVSKIQKLVETVKLWAEKSEDQIQISLLDYLRKNEALQAYRFDLSLYKTKIKNLKEFAEGFEEECKRDISTMLKEKLIEETNKHIEEFIQKHSVDIPGCHERCPLCGAKCILPGNPINHQHKVATHLVPCFHQMIPFEGNNKIPKNCFSSSNYQGAWQHSLGKVKKSFKEFDEMIDNEYKQWRKEFPTKNDINRFKDNLDPVQIECWMGTKDVLIKYFNYADKTPIEWENFLVPEKKLASNTIIEGYIFDDNN